MMKMYPLILFNQIIKGLKSMPKKNTHLFTDLCYCQKCGKKMRFIKDRYINKYICSTYNRTRECIRNAIEEHVLIELLKNHYNVHNKTLILTNVFLRQEIQKIIINENNILIKCRNLPNVICNNFKISFLG
jgi:hypothetical protein